MEIKEGMYVRTRGGTIGILGKPMGLGGRHEIINSLNQLYAEEDVRHDNVKRTSYELIDLIQKGDYVNGKEIIGIKVIDNKKEVCFSSIQGCYYTNDEIKSIVTKEQFEEMQYKVGE